MFPGRRFSATGFLCTLILGVSAATSAAAAPTDIPPDGVQDYWCEESLWRDVRVPSLSTVPLPSVGVDPAQRDAPESLLYSLALSGGGYRAMLFHVGALRRLNDAGLLSRLTLVSSVSGGSIAAAYLAYKWKSLLFNAEGRATNFDEEVELPIREFARTTIDVPSAIGGLLPFTTTANELSKSLDRVLFKRDAPNRTMLSEIAPGGSSVDGRRPRPVFVLVATSLQTAEMWQFRALAMGGPQVGWTSSRGIPLADAVAASAGFPPVFASLRLDLSARDPISDWHECSEARDNPFGIDHRNAPGKVIASNQLPEFRRSVVLADGGIRDNLGIAVIEETNRVRLLRSKGSRSSTATFVSDGGASIEMDPTPAANWWSVLMRVTGIMSDEPSDVRVANLIRTQSLTLLNASNFDQFTNNRCVGERPDQDRQDRLVERETEYRRRIGGLARDEYAYWSIRRMPKYHLGYGCPPLGSRLESEVRELSRVPTRLSSMDDALQARLINWGYLAAHQGIPYIDRLSVSREHLRDLRASCSMPYAGGVVDPKGETPSARDTRCFVD